MDIEYRNSIVRYYDETIGDYKWLWSNKKNKSVHFGYYDDTAKSHADALMNLNRQMALRSGVSDGDVILDAGCGQGGSAMFLVENYNVVVHGITLVPHQVRMAQEESQKRGIADRTHFSVQDYTDTNFDDGSFDVVWACESLCHAQSKALFYKEAFRLLRPGGRLIIADYARKQRAMDEDSENLLMSWLSGWSIKDIDTVEEHEDHAISAGFKNVKIEDITAHTRPSLRHLHNMSRRLWSLGKVLKTIGLRNRVNHGNHFASIKQYEALNNDLWKYIMIQAEK